MVWCGVVWCGGCGGGKRGDSSAASVSSPLRLYMCLSKHRSEGNREGFLPGLDSYRLAEQIVDIPVLSGG